jgi:hypothetical protein
MTIQTEDRQHPASVEDDLEAKWRRVVGRRSFLFASDSMAAAGAITRGDIAILRFLAAAELIESDLWQQYNEPLARTVAIRRTWRRCRTSTATCRSTSPTTPMTS